jgi:hypothetical protein
MEDLQYTILDLKDSGKPKGLCAKLQGSSSSSGHRGQELWASWRLAAPATGTARASAT